MSIIATKNKFHAALDGIGLLLQGAPGAIAYQQNQAPIYGNRFASGDRSYTDFSFWWFWAQTDFSGGIKQEVEWADDATLHSSEGINITENPGALVLNWRQDLSNSVAKNMTFTDYGNATGVAVLVGRNVTDQKMRAVKLIDGTTVWEDSATGADERICCCDEFGNGDLYLGCRTVGSGASTLKITTGGSASDVGTFASGDGIRAMVPYKTGDAMYLFTGTAGIYLYSRSAGTFTQKTTGYPLGVAVGSISASNENGKGVWLIGDRIYFLLRELSTFRSQLWAYDIGDNAYVHIYTWGPGIAVTRAIERDDALYLFDTNNNTQRIGIWKYGGSTGVMERFHEVRRSGETSILVANPTRDSSYIYFTVNDGSSDYQIWQIDRNDHVFSGITPPAAYATAISMLAMSSTGNLGVVKNGASGTNRFDSFFVLPNQARQTTGFGKTGIFDGEIPAIDKLFHSITLNFAPLPSSAVIAVSYSLDGGANFVSLGNVSNATDGGSIVSKTLYFGSAVVAKTMMLMFTLTSGGGNSTPTLNSYSAQYVPVVDYAKSWTLNINCGTEVRDLGGAPVPQFGRELRGQLEKTWLTKSLVDFQDLDYAGTTLNTGGGALSASATTITVLDTADFPERGRLRCENEEIIYTGKTPTTFTGCVRGARGTVAATHVDASVINNAYRVIVTEMSERIPLALDSKFLEYTIAVTVREA